MTKDKKKQKLMDQCLKYNTEQLLNNLYNMGYDRGWSSINEEFLKLENLRLGQIEDLKKEIKDLKKELFEDNERIIELQKIIDERTY